MVWAFLLRRFSGRQKQRTMLTVDQSRHLAWVTRKAATQAIASAILSLIALATPMADETGPLTCPQKYLSGEAAQEMMVKGVIMHTQLRNQENEDHTKYTFIHTVRADWTIWICIQTVDVSNGTPDNLRISCTACDY
ncbi:MAG: hypothetical protein CMM32_07090 [Rhodospirillaceae bacterium]|nr:hypothetical protein [Rhodospirillaceae bacterium]|tara:strand:- start:425 stop:835 length:411 start_codon:yes stop_codon:yes gene_type:complete